MAEMRKLTAYFSQWCPESTWNAQTEKIFDDLFHPDCQIVGKNERFDFAAWKNWYRRSIVTNQRIDMERVVQDSPTTIVYTLLIYKDDSGGSGFENDTSSDNNDNNPTVIRHTAKGIFQDGKLIRTEPANPRIYDIMTAATAPKKRKPVPIL